jgi:hypothetical protein
MVAALGYSVGRTLGALNGGGFVHLYTAVLLQSRPEAAT